MLKRGIAGVLLIALLWRGGVTLFDVPSYLLPGPGAVMDRLGFLSANADLVGHVHVTLVEIFWGFVIGLLAGVVAAVLFARVPVTERLATPLILLLQTAPKIVLIAIVPFFPVMTGMLSGLRFVNKSYLDLAQVLKLSAWQRFRHIELPASLPTLFAGATVATTQAMTAAVIGKLMGSNEGMGYLLSSGQEHADTATVIGVVLLLSLTGWLFYEVAEALRRRMEARFSDVCPRGRGPSETATAPGAPPVPLSYPPRGDPDWELDPCPRPLGSPATAPEGPDRMTSRSQPDIIFIMTDNQQAGTLGGFGNAEIHTPHLDALSAAGATFENAYCPNAFCSPSRASMMTGLIPSQHGVHS